MTKEEIIKQYELLKNSDHPIYYYQLIDAIDNIEETFKNALFYYKELNTWHVYFNQRDSFFLEKMHRYIIGDNDLSLEKLVINELHKRNFFISCAESCTGGMIISRLIGVSGASNVIAESYVTYSNEAKIRILGVNKNTISDYSVTSVEVAEEMARGLYKISKSNICISVTGFAGGDIKDPNDGMCFFGIYINDNHSDYLHLEKIKVDGNRNECRYAQGTYILWRTLLLLRS